MIIQFSSTIVTKHFSGYLLLKATRLLKRISKVEIYYTVIRILDINPLHHFSVHSIIILVIPIKSLQIRNEEPILQYK